MRENEEFEVMLEKLQGYSSLVMDQTVDKLGMLNQIVINGIQQHYDRLD